MKAVIKAISYKNNSILLEDLDGDEKWLKLADNVKPSYCKKGEAEITVKDGIVTYVKMGEIETKEVKMYPKANIEEKSKYWEEKDKRIENQWAINAAIELIKLIKIDFSSVEAESVIKELAIKLKKIREEI